MAQNTKLVISQVMMPSQTNPNGNVHGGEIMKMMDSTAYAVTRRYAHSNVVTARVDEVEFHSPILIGDLVTCTATIVFVGHSSMEVAVNVDVEDLDVESKPQRALTAYFTMVALDRNSRPKARRLLKRAAAAMKLIRHANASSAKKKRSAHWPIKRCVSRKKISKSKKLYTFT